MLINKFSSDGNFLGRIGSQGTGDGQFISPGGLAFDKDQNLYVVDQGNSRIQQFSSSGIFLGKIGDWDKKRFYFPGSIKLGRKNDYFVEFEQAGQDRAAYGSQMLQRLSDELRQRGLKGRSDRSLRQFRQFYLTYPEIWQSLTAKSHFIDLQKHIHINPMTPSVNPAIPPLEIGLLLERLTFTHFSELLRVEYPLKRRFYEIEALKNNWTIRDLRRAISTLLYERTGLSTDKARVIAKAKGKQSPDANELIRNPYLLEFLGLEEKSEYSENDLEVAIINHLQDFLLEMGRGFCFEARQKRISFNNRHYRIDLVFYHRILKCHVLIDLKVGEFDHADAGQMNVYLNYYRKYEMSEGDNPPVGIILCADKDTPVRLI